MNTFEIPRTVYFICERNFGFFSRRIFLQNLLALLGGSPSPVDDVIITINGSSSSLNFNQNKQLIRRNETKQFFSLVYQHHLIHKYQQ